MRLDFETIKKITTGAVKITEKDGKISFFRLTETQADAFVKENENHIKKVFATAGVRFDFYTNSKTLKIRFCDMKRGSSRTFYSFDVYENGKFIYEYFGNYKEITEDEFEVKLSGEGRVQVFFPNLTAPKIEYVQLDDGAYVKPFEADVNLVMYGDSITHGYDATASSLSYANIVASRLNANVINTAIGGAIFNPDIIEKIDSFDADIVTVAYGTNDWRKLEKSVFEKNFIEFIEKLKFVYKNTPVYFILPIWRGNCDTITNCGTFSEHREYMKTEIEKRGYTAIESIDFVPHNTRMFSPDMLHPNDSGFIHYANNLLKYIK